MTQCIVSGPDGETCWQVYAGDRNMETFEFLAGDDPWDIEGAVLSAQARLTALDEVVAVTAVCAVSTEALGLATVEWDGEDVRTLLAGADRWEGVWDLQVLEQGQTLPITVARGPFVAILDVTRVEGQ